MRLLRFQVSGFILSFFLTACAHERVSPSSLSASVSATRLAITRAQHAAAALPSTPATTAAISDLRAQLAAVGVSYDATTAKVQWYQTDWTRLDAENSSLKNTVTAKDAALATQQKVIHQTAKERDFYPFLLGLLAAVLVGVTFVPWALKLPGLLGFIVPPGIVAAGGIFGFTASRMLAAWGSRLIP
jgi:cobalamin biosynthesis Mg chelatase CobN